MTRFGLRRKPQAVSIFGTPSLVHGDFLQSLFPRELLSSRFLIPRRPLSLAALFLRESSSLALPRRLFFPWFLPVRGFFPPMGGFLPPRTASSGRDGQYARPVECGFFPPAHLFFPLHAWFFLPTHSSPLARRYSLARCRSLARRRSLAVRRRFLAVPRRIMLVPGWNRAKEDGCLAMRRLECSIRVWVD